ncbi:MAG: FAD-binding protein [Ruminococcaceae bacterium]|nr:FAD-binding protein [Oscillospiraceae bacterium]
MKQLDNISISAREDSPERLRRECAKRMSVSADGLGEVRILRRSVDARRKDNVKIIYSVECGKKGERLPQPPPYTIEKVTKKPRLRPIVVGSGPAGMLCALTLAQAGLSPIVLERGMPADQRVKAVEQYFGGGELNPESNIQFGEGGAGTFSDGKLNTGIRDPRIAHVYRVFIEAGAPADIVWQAKPHIGTDILRKMVVGIRKRIIELGGEYRFNTRLEDIAIENGCIRSITVAHEGEREEIECERLVLATGHSARDTFEMLRERGFAMEKKAFSIGARIEHPQTHINKAQYGSFADAAALGAADYKLAAKTADGRGVYTFCMCPGGRVVAAASEPESIVTNGMSLRARGDINANSAVLVSVGPEDFPDSDPLAGMYMQRVIERAAYAAVGKSSRAPAQLLGDLLAGRASKAAGSVQPSYCPGVTWGELGCCLPKFVVDGIADGCRQFDRRLHGFLMPDAVLTGPETRSSSPVRILRDDALQASVRGVFPCGEGAGYAGGITSAAVDGVRCAEMLIKSI